MELRTIKPWLRQIYLFLYNVYDRFVNDGCLTRAAALTYTTLLSLVPLMAVGFAVLSAFPFFKNLSVQIQNFIFQHFVATSGEVVQSYLQHFVAQTGNISAIGFFFLATTAILMIYNMEEAFNEIWHVRYRRSGIASFTLYWAVLTLFPLLLGLSLLLSSYLFSLPIIAGTVITLRLASPLFTILPFILTAITFALLYVTVPNCKVPIVPAIIGAFIAAVLFEIAKLAFAFYVVKFANYALLYGALATIPIFLLWLYISWSILLFGAVISNVLAVGHRYRSEKKIDGFTHAYLWMKYFWEALQQGKMLSLQNLVDKDIFSYQIEPERQIELLVRKQLIQPTTNGRYILIQNLSTLTFYQLYQILPWRLPTTAELNQYTELKDQRYLRLIDAVGNKIKDDIDEPVASLFKGE